MGNSPSKSSSSRPSSSSNGNNSLPPFTRSDTSNSAKSGRSLRSRRSNRDSIYSNDAASFKSASNTSPIISRKSSSKSVSNMINEFNTQQEQDQQQEQQINTQQQTSEDNQELPPSMIQIPPRNPILMRNNSEGNLETPMSELSVNTNGLQIPQQQQQQNSYNNTPITPTNASFKSISTYGTPISPVELNNNSNNNNKEIPITSPVLSRIPTNNTNTATPTTSTTPQPQQNRDVNIEDFIQRLLDAGYSGKRTKNVCLKNSEIAIICATAREIFLSQPSLLELSPPVKIVGDVHGQFNDLIRIFTKCGFPPLSNYLFLGDYVDRGKQSLETILLLLCYKIKYPENFFLLRGNHECAGVTRVYGFLDECKRRCNTKTWKCFIDTFNTLPILATVASKIFCVHGGLSPVLSSMDEIRRIQRPTDIPDFGLLNDLVWSDPADTINEWEDNERGVSYCFNKIAINKFLNKFQFDLVVRAHMVVEDGYEFFNERSLVTVFSAPNYCGEFDNWGAVMSVNDELLCSFELLDPLDSAALKQVMKKGRMERSLYM